MLYEVSIYDNKLKGFLGLHQFSYKQIDDPTGNEGFREKVADAARRLKIEANEIKILHATPEPGDPGYRCSTTPDMSGVQG